MSKEEQRALVANVLADIFGHRADTDAPQTASPAPISITISTVGTLNILCRQQPPADNPPAQ